MQRIRCCLIVIAKCACKLLVYTRLILFNYGLVRAAKAKGSHLRAVHTRRGRLSAARACTIKREAYTRVQCESTNFTLLRFSENFPHG